MKTFSWLLVLAMGCLTSFALGWESRGKAKGRLSIQQDYSRYDVWWQIVGEPPIALCRGPKIDHRMQFITCLMEKGTVAPWAAAGESQVH